MKTNSLLSTFFLFLLFLLLSSSPALACKCRPATLEEYYKNAGEVFLAEVSQTATDADGNRVAEFRLLEPSFKGSITGIEKLRSRPHSASCGIPFTKGAKYIFFTPQEKEDRRIPWVHSCAGSRRIDSDSGEELFVALPRKFLEQRLVQLFARSKKGSIGGIPHKESIIGLLDYPLSELYASNSLGSEKLPKGFEVVSRESGYEVNAAAVFEKQGEWLRLQGSLGESVWARVTSEMHYHPLETLLPRRLGYLTEDFNGVLWSDPGAGSALRVTVKKEQHVEIERAEKIADSLWFYVKILKSNPCEGEAKKVAASGWIPAWNAEGQLTSWFWSRGC